MKEVHRHQDYPVWHQSMSRGRVRGRRTCQRPAIEQGRLLTVRSRALER